MSVVSVSETLEAPIAGGRAWKPKRAILDRATLGLTALILLVAVVGPEFAPGDVNVSRISDALRAPSAAHWLGTDDQGRDIAWRVVSGIRISIFSAVLVVAVFALTSILLVAICTFGPRWLDSLIMRFTDIGLSVPGLPLCLGFAAAFGPSLRSAIFALFISGWPFSTRLLRAAVRETMSRPYVESAVTLGTGRIRIFTRTVLPNSLDVLVVKWAGDIGQTILVIASLSYIGLGAQPPSPELGAMVSAEQPFITSAWWAPILPGLTIALIAAAFGLLGDLLQRKLVGGRA